MKYEARNPAGGSEGSSTRRKKVRKTKAKVASKKKTDAFNGVLMLSAEAFGQFEACVTNPGEPTQGAVRGAALLRKLYSKSR